MHFKYDYRAVRDLAIQATLEARKPQYAQLPQRLCLHEDLIFAYVGTDPEGHAEQIQQALDYMRQEVSTDLECRFCVQNCRSEFAMQRGKLDEAEAASLQLLAMTDAEKNRHTAEHHALEAYSDLCAIAFARGHWQALREWSALGEETARRQDKPLGLAEYLAWKALLEARDGHPERAKRLYRQAAARVARLKAVPSESYFEALCAYHEQVGDLEAPWASAVRNCKPSPARDGSLTRAVECSAAVCWRSWNNR